MIFGINTTRDISKLSQITYNNFEISRVVFMPNITTNHAITYTNPEFRILSNFKILGFQNPQFKILANFKILAVQNPEFKILADIKILA